MYLVVVKCNYSNLVQSLNKSMYMNFSLLTEEMLENENNYKRKIETACGFWYGSNPRFV